MKKEWTVEYSHDDGRQGTVNVTTTIEKSKNATYGNGYAGLLQVSETSQGYDLRYSKGDLHMIMIKDYFGKGLVKATEV